MVNYRSKHVAKRELFQSWSKHSTRWLVLALGLFLCGCGSKNPATTPVEGKVSYQGKPLPRGNVVLQPSKGPPARGVIGPDGTFRLSTHRDGDGAVLGTHRVRIACYAEPLESMRGQEQPAGKSLIPTKYTRCDTSGLTVEIKSHNEPLLFELK